MNHRNLALVASVLLAGAIAHGASPDALSGVIYRDQKQSSLGLGVSNALIYLRPDGTFVELARLGGRTVHVWAGASLDAGTYAYTKTGATTGSLALQDQAAASPQVFALTFSDDRSGSVAADLGFAGTFAVATFPGALPLLNLSCRTRVDSGGVAIAGFVVSGTRRTVLARVVGPGLAAFGVADPLPDPAFTLFRGSSSRATVAEGWADTHFAVAPPQESIARVAEACGAFPLAADSRDAARVLDLDPSAYTIHAGSAGAGAGECLIEIYVLP